MRKLLLSLPLLVILAACATTPRARAVPTLESWNTITVLNLVELYAERTAPSGDYDVLGNSAAAYLMPLENAALKRGLAVHYTPLMGYMGMTDGSNWILIEQALGTNSRVSTLLHEYAHVLGCQGPNKPENEVCAETASFLAARQIGLDTMAPSFNYLLTHADEGLLVRVLWRDKAKIAAIVETIRGELLTR